MGYSLWGHKESDTTEATLAHVFAQVELGKRRDRKVLI